MRQKLYVLYSYIDEFKDSFAITRKSEVKRFTKLLNRSGKVIKQCFPNFFVCWHRIKAKQISLHTSHINLFKFIASSIACDSKKGDDLLFWRSTLFRVTGNTISHVIDLYFMAAFAQFWLKTCKNINLKNKKTRGTQLGKHCYKVLGG